MKKLTVRELLHKLEVCRVSLDYGDIDTLAERVEKVLALHHRAIGMLHCVECSAPELDEPFYVKWPCATVRALEGESYRGGPHTFRATDFRAALREAVAEERSRLRARFESMSKGRVLDEKYLFTADVLAALAAREAAEPGDPEAMKRFINDVCGAKTEPPALPLGHEYVSDGGIRCRICTAFESAHKPAREKEGA